MKTVWDGELTEVLDCTMADCAYNINDECHAAAITVGSPCPMCDTYIRATEKGGIDDVAGCVGACKMDDCRHNSMLECMASGIHIGQHDGHGECWTFAAK